MLGSKKQTDPSGKEYIILPAWDWVNPEYLFNLPFRRIKNQRNHNSIPCIEWQTRTGIIMPGHEVKKRE
jgi:hypothetical protein